MSDFDYRRAWEEAMRGAEAGMVEGGIERPFPHAGLRPGDPPPPSSGRDSVAGRVLLANTASPWAAPPNPGVRSGSLISTNDVGYATDWSIQLRFANVNADGTPAVWSPLTQHRVRVVISRGVDQQAPAQVDECILDTTGNTGEPIQWLQLSTVKARQLDITIHLDVAVGGSQAQWCEAVVTPVTVPQYGPAARGGSNIFGSGFAATIAWDVSNADPGTLILTQRAWRCGFLIHVPHLAIDATAEPVLFRFGAPVSADRDTYSFALNPGQSYEAFPEYYWGAVYARGAINEAGTVPVKATILDYIGTGGG